MQTVHDSTITTHVRRAVVAHGFADADDWAAGLAELADFTDEEIDGLLDAKPGTLTTPLIEAALCVAELRQGSGWGYGIGQEQATADRALFGRWRSLLGGSLRAAMVCGMVALSAASASAMEISGPATVIDGDTLIVAGHHVRIWGIDAPEHDQPCRRIDGAQWPCGEFSRDAMARLVAGARTVCTTVTTDKYGRDVARCAVEGDDLGGELVREGRARDWSHYSHGAYAAQEADARQGYRGIWAGTFENPWDWRHAHAEEVAR